METSINKARFGAFVAEERKRLGLTQKELAERLYLSDKAISKWERGLSLPDVALLIPLAETLGVTVTELLEGRRIQPGAGMEMGEVEQLVKRTLSLSGETPEENRARRKRNALCWAACVAGCVAEVLALFWIGHPPRETEWVFLGLGVLFGGWAWTGIRERLPAYYDQDRISFYSDGIFKLSMPGIAFHNRNWPHIVRALRVWTSVLVLGLPVVAAILGAVLGEGVEKQMVLLVLFLSGLILPVYVVGRRYDVKG